MTSTLARELALPVLFLAVGLGLGWHAGSAAAARQRAQDASASQALADEASRQSARADKLLEARCDGLAKAADGLIALMRKRVTQ